MMLKSIYSRSPEMGDSKTVVFVNYDFHQKHTKLRLFGVVTPNKSHNIKHNKWLWKLEGFMTANQIFAEYGIAYNELPQSSRRLPSYQNQVSDQYDLAQNMNVDVIKFTDWNSIQQIKSLRRDRDGRKNRKYRHSPYRLVKPQWIKKCVKWWNKLEAIPIVVNENKNGLNCHWIEWVKLIPLYEEYDDESFVGVSCRYLMQTNEWRITSICLDKGDVENKHRLLGLSREFTENYNQRLYNFNTTFTEIQWIKS
eukprot:TRINITY_DN7805_c0_g1_i1.p1 TRINITY_DN7805_c0_g1~~TRINITY_DN7805_c0_g1_i1.p1  ORF type:complete len:253 (-),score=29.22 TRINITY_DN7805_c0_g1_i1:47-805(-)